jgi:hypothetical protein
MFHVSIYMQTQFTEFIFFRVQVVRKLCIARKIAKRLIG